MSARIEFVDRESELSPDYASLQKFVSMPDLLVRVENDVELLSELLVMFQEELPGLLDALNRAVDAADPPEISRAAHALKGMLANLSMNQGASLAGAIEAAARADDVPGIEKTIVDFNFEMSALSAAVNNWMVGHLK